MRNTLAQFGASRQESLVEDSGKNSWAQNVQILIKKLGDFNVFWLVWAPAHSANPGLPDRVAQAIWRYETRWPNLALRAKKV